MLDHFEIIGLGLDRTADARQIVSYIGQGGHDLLQGRCHGLPATVRRAIANH